ncbi:MAG: hypothetical protein ACI8RZ_001092 [Myxococcota bacterium]|jgi:hypothetical protein
MRVIGWMLRGLLWAVILGIPLAGIWLASSLAALLNGPVWLTALGGALLFPILPLTWDAFATWRKRKKKSRRRESSFLDDLSSKRRTVSMGFIDRLMLRTLILNVAFLGLLLSNSPTTAASALTARGDWMLDGVEAPWVEDARSVIFAIADRTERLAEEENTWADDGQPPPPPPPPDVSGIEDGSGFGVGSGSESHEPAPTATLLPVMPDGATGRITGTELTVEDGVPLPLTPGDYEMIAMLADGRGIACPISVDWAGWSSAEPTLGLVRGDPWYLGPAPCEQFQSPNPTWRPALHLVLGTSSADRPGTVPFQPVGGEEEWLTLQDALLGPEGITDVQIREPYIRLTLTDEASAALCAATDTPYLRRLAAVADGEVRYTTPIYEKLCSGVVSLPMTAAVAQRSGHERAESVIDQQGGDHSRWKHHDAPHPILDTIPPQQARSIQGIGRHLKSQLSDPFERARAVHDFVATTVAYDTDSLLPGQRAPQDADTVFTTGEGVCAGYANLMVAIGAAADLDIVYLVGHSRDEEGGVAGSMHAWNAVKLEGKWYLIDATWDAGGVGADGFEYDYKTDYLLTPPQYFRITHLPEEPAWQLAAPALSRGEFTRLPMLRPSFFEADLSLIGIERSQVTVDDTLNFQIDNPRSKHFLVDIETEDGTRSKCSVGGGKPARVRCDFPHAGSYTVLLFHNDTKAGSYTYDGRILVNVSG